MICSLADALPIPDTAEKFISGVIDTGEKFFGGVVDTGDKF
jgi:hypothetical protein